MNRIKIAISALSITLLYVDLFCGAGGTSTGVETAKINGEKCAKVIACVNHDANAIASHAENHPETLHYTEDIRTLELEPLAEFTSKMRQKYPLAKLVLWASLECTNFSKAKGGMARDADSRTLAEHLDRYIIALNPDSVQIENVEEFMSWGDLDENGKPISRDKGRLYTRWIDHIKTFGYDYEYRILNSADFGALTSRKRFFAQFNKPGFPIVWPYATHSKKPETGLFGCLEKWRPVKEVLDFSDKGQSIFRRKKPLVEATLERIYHGMVKFVPEDNECVFIDQQFGKSKSASIDTVLGAVTVNPKYSIVSCKNWLMNTNFKNIGSSLDSSAPTITANRKWMYLMDAQYKRVGNSLEQPCFTLIARMDKTPPYLVEIDGCADLAPFIVQENDRLIYMIYDTDSPMMVKIKEFMAMYGLTDIKMRMLKIQELKEIMGFPKDYVLIGTQADQKKFIGNAVEVTMARKICEATAGRLLEKRKAA